MKVPALLIAWMAVLPDAGAAQGPPRRVEFRNDSTYTWTANRSSCSGVGGIFPAQRSIT